MEEEEREEERWRGPEGTYSLGIVCGDLGPGRGAPKHAPKRKRWAFCCLLRETRCFTLAALRAPSKLVWDVSLFASLIGLSHH
jgi:hypothetical protein